MTPFAPMRYVDAFPVDHEGERLVCVVDPSGFVDEQLILSGPAFFIAACLDGEQEVADIQRAFRAQFGRAEVSEAQIREVVDYLDAHGFLLNERFAQLCAEKRRDYAALKVRPAWLAGKSYPAAPEELRAYIQELFGGQWPPVEEAAVAPLKCLVVPHIDFERGAPAYADGYRSLAAAGRPDLVFIFGVAHAGAPVPFVLTRKAFETPFGTLETDQAVLDRLEAACTWDPYEHELAHRTEHSVEFQAVMLAALYGPQVKIVPILCASFSGEPGLCRPETLPDVQRFLEVCAEVAAEPGRRVSVIAGADLAHVGRRFGDDFDISDEIVGAVEGRDREDLEQVFGCAPEAFYGSVMKDDNARRVCGLGCIYAALKTVENQVEHTELLHYGYAPDPAGGMVSFASVELR